jgi:hypothetical protein
VSCHAVPILTRNPRELRRTAAFVPIRSTIGPGYGVKAAESSPSALTVARDDLSQDANHGVAVALVVLVDLKSSAGLRVFRSR